MTMLEPEVQRTPDGAYKVVFHGMPFGTFQTAEGANAVARQKRKEIAEVEKRIIEYEQAHPRLKERAAPIVDRLKVAFKTLRRQGYVCKHDWQCCSSCGWARIDPKRADRAVFYNAQDTEHLERKGDVYLSWDGDGTAIVDALRAAGLNAEWDGDPGRRIFVKGLVLQ